MPTDLLTHPPAEQLAAFNRGELAAPDRAWVEEHVAACNSCCARLTELSEAPLAGLARQAALQSTGEFSIHDCPPELIDHPRYKVTGRLGAGGMGVVYRAEHRVMSRTVALKVMARRYTANKTAVERFRREVQAAARLAHPNIVTAHDADEANGTHFLVMEYVEGVSLDRLVRRRGPLPVATACQIIRQAALGLQHAHEKGMVHRDVKPHNLMVNRKGHVKVLDFGLARLAAETDGDLDGTPPTGPTVTSPSLMLGTPDYVAPEQAKSASAAGPRSDIYALGCTLYFLLTGRAPFSASGTALEKLVAHATDTAPPIRSSRADVSPEVEALVARMMAKDPAARPATAADVATTLRAFTKSAAIDAEPDFVPDPVVPLPGATTADAGLDETPPIVRRNRLTKKVKKRRRKAPRWLPIALGIPAVLALAAVGYALTLGDKNKSKDTGRQVTDGRPPVTSPQPPAGKKSTAPTPAVAGTGRKVLFIIPQRGLFLRDYQPVRARLESHGIVVETASTSKAECVNWQTDGSVGPPSGVRADWLLNDVNPADFQGVIFCGADVREFLPPSPASAQLGKIVIPMKGTKAVGAICTGQEVLLTYRLLQGKAVAECPQFKDPSIYSRTGALPTKDQKVVTAGNFVTAAGPDYADQFADAIAAIIP
jgi:eukaryotic-like serine/threonine-protein kinase